MTKDEWNELAIALAESWKRNGVAELEAGVSSEERQETKTVESAVRRVVERQAEIQGRDTANVRPTMTSGIRATPTSKGGSTAMEALKIAGMVTGVGPVVTGLIKLFGGGSDDKHELPAPARYDLPQSVHLDAGLMASRSVAPVSYAQNNQVRADVVPQPAEAPRMSTAAMPAIQIQVNAMDSRSFMDHSDEIAQAVRAAMLRSHSINDVISEV